MSADYKIATRPFLFCLDKAAVLNDFSALLSFEIELCQYGVTKHTVVVVVCFVSLAHPDQIDHFKRRIH